MTSMSTSRPSAGIAIVVAGCFILAVAAGLRQMSGVFLLPITGDLDIGRQSFGLAIGVQNLVWGLSQPLAGYLSDRHGARPVAVFCALIYSAGLAASSVVSGSIGLALALGVMTGVGQAGTSYAVILGAVGKAVPEHRRSSVLGLTSAAGSLGMFVLVPVSQALVSSQGWRAAFLFLGAISFLGAVAALALGSKEVTAEDQHGPPPATSFLETLRPAFRNGGWWLLTTGFTVCGFQLAFIATYLPSALTDASMSAATGAQVLATIGFSNIIGTYIFGVVGRTRPKSRVLVFIYLARGAALLAFALLPKTTLTVYAFGAAIGLLWSATVPLSAGLVSDLFGHRNVAFLFALVYIGHQIGSFMGAWAGGIVYNAVGSYAPMWTATVVMSFVAAALHWPIRLPAKPTRTASQVGAHA